MPHQCTNCGRTFADGSKEMLSGCPDCGGNKFQFRPADGLDGTDPDRAGSDPASADAPGETTPDGPAPDGTTSTPGTAPDPGRSDATPSDPAPSGTAGADPTPAAPPDADEDGAQATARSEVVSEDEIAAAGPEPGDGDPTEQEAPTEPDDEEPVDPNLDALRRKLNDQFESIRIVSPGQYELNLMELYDREEYIISLREDGRYVIEMPEGWDDR